MDQTPQVISTENIKKMKLSDIPCRMGDNCTNPTCSYKHSGRKRPVCIYLMRGHCRAGSNRNYFYSDTKSPQVAESEESNNSPKKKIKAVDPMNVGAGVKLNPDGDFSAKEFVLEKKPQFDTKPNTDVADTSKPSVTLKEDIKASQKLCSETEVAELVAKSSRKESSTEDKQVEPFQQQLINKPKKDEGIIYSKFRNCSSHYKETTKICSKERRK